MKKNKSNFKIIEIPIERYTFKNKDENLIIEGLTKFGIVKIKNFLNYNDCKKLKDTSLFLLSNNDPSIRSKHDHENNKNGLNVNIDPNILSKSSKILNKIFNCKFLRKISKSYYSPNKYNHNKDIMLVSLKKDKKEILPWHFDRKQSLKFWIYLTETNKKNGAMEYSPGTQWEGRYRANNHIMSGETLRSLRNDVNKERLLVKTVLKGGPRDLFIFDSDGFHKGGNISSGKRLVIRSHSYPFPIIDWDYNYLSTDYLKKQLSKFTNYFQNSQIRKIGFNSEKFESKSRPKITRKYIKKKL
jgi:hypothetical protein